MEIRRRSVEAVVEVKAARYIVDFLIREGVTHVFEMAGGAIAHLLDAVDEREEIAAVPMRHEQAAAFAAEGYARVAGDVGVAMATSGPGALNLLTGIGSCYFDSVPCLFLTGQVNTYEYKGDASVRQNGFQETDIVSVAAPLTKYAALVERADRLRYELEKALRIARSGRPGPVLLDIPMDVQRAEVDPAGMEAFDEGEQGDREEPTDEEVRRTVRLLRGAARPIVLTGGGVRAAGAVPVLRGWLASAGIPVVCSLMGLDAVEAAYEWNMGLIGSYGHRYANMALANCDCLLVLGSRLDTRQTGTRPKTFARGAKIIHVDIDASELGRKIRPELAVRAHLRPFLEKLSERWVAKPPSGDWSAWKERLSFYRRSYPTGKPQAEGGAIEPNRLMERLARETPDDAIVCLDVGQHQMWASQSWPVGPRGRLLNAGGMGAMGFGLPAAIGAAFAAPGRPIVLVAGDGGLQVNLQELQTVVHWRLPIAMFVLNNRSLGMVRQFQDLYFGGRRASTVSGYSCPDFVKVARAYGLPAFRAADGEELEARLQAGFRKNAEEPALLEIELSPAADVLPKLGVGRPIEDMEPLLERAELRRQMIVPPLDDD
ncbi:thiamine pyrophosphate-binding protein [Paenibacillaceae bacterium WGS1546]|uniref:thiamine pyrophosphate-binding protein n=1 Tax=Cohnella sp. WGS1546 TaxID=3366810 RepID=UPI00372D04EC